MNQLKITYSRSSGPGGQNVNCVDTKVDIRFHVASVDWLSEETKKLLLEQVCIRWQHCCMTIVESMWNSTFILLQQRGRITKDGYFVLKNEATRFQQTNLADGLETIRNIIRKLERATKSEASPETIEKHRRKWVNDQMNDRWKHFNEKNLFSIFCRHEKATRERLMVKRERSMIKADRRGGNDSIV